MSEAVERWYKTDDAFPFPGLAFEPGDKVLVSGGWETESRELGVRLLALAHESGDALVVTNNRNTDALVESYRRHTGGDAPYVVDSSPTGTSTTPEGLSEDRFSRLNSPSDMTGISIEFQKYLGSVGDARGAFLFDSLTNLLQYVDAQMAYKFASTMAGNLVAEDVLSVFVIDPEAVGEEKARLFANEFDYELRLGERGDGSEVSLHGHPDVSEEPVPYVAADGG